MIKIFKLKRKVLDIKVTIKKSEKEAKYTVPHFIEERNKLLNLFIINFLWVKRFEFIMKPPNFLAPYYSDIFNGNCDF